MDNEELAIGIDLGTTYSCVAVMRDGNVEIIPNEFDENVTPSVVTFIDNGILVGEQALNQIIKNPKKTIYSIKRLIGRKYYEKEVQKDIKSNFWSFDIVEEKSNNTPIVKIEDEKNNFSMYYYPEQISRYILEKLVQNARNYLNKPIRKAVITVPAYFQDAQRKATELAANLAGLEVLRIVNEPTAASLAYGLNKKLPKKVTNNPIFYLNKEKNQNINEKKINNDEDDDQLIIVFDLGGGTFDVTLLQIEDQELFNVLATAGDSHLGGDDFNKKIIDYCLKEFSSHLNINENDIRKDAQAMNRLKIAAEKAKIKLSYELETTIDIDEFFNGELLHIKITREIFENLCKDLFMQLIKPINKVLDDGGKGYSDINEIIFVGGSTKIPKIKEIIRCCFFDIHINDSINPDETVAYGAAIHAAKLMKQGNDILNDVILMDITPFSLGIDAVDEDLINELEQKGCVMDVIIPRGTKIPVKMTKRYQTSYDYQDTISIGIYEGENKYVKDNHLLGEFSLVNLPMKKEGEVKDDVTFSIDSNGILTVSATEVSEGIISNSIDIINDKGYNKEIIIDEINTGTPMPLINNEDKEFKNYKKEMGDYYKFYEESYNPIEKYKYLYNFSEVLINFLDSFEKEGNDTLGNKYFLYIKVLFNSYRTLLQLNSQINDVEKNQIINNSIKFIEILSSFKNINYKNYIELLNYFVIPLSKEEKKKPIEFENQINELRNDILFNIVIYVIELIEKKAEKILELKLNYSRFNAKYLFQNCILISELFIKSERDLAKNRQIRNRHNSCIDKCKTEIKKINANSLIEIDKIKKSGKLIENGEDMDREELLILLDNYRQTLKNLEGLEDYESEAIILANIVKINYKYIKSEKFEELRTMSEQCVALAKSTNKNVEQFKWYLEITQILQELRKRFEDKEKYEQEMFENKYKEEKRQIFEEINEYRKKSTVEFIEFILKKYPPKSPLKKNKVVNVNEEWKKNAQLFVTKLSGRYSPDNYPKNTEEEKLKFTIYHTISTQINAILSGLNSNVISLKG